MGGIAGWDAGETTDESVEMVEMVRRMTVAYLRSCIQRTGLGRWRVNTGMAVDGNIVKGRCSQPAKLSANDNKIIRTDTWS